MAKLKVIGICASALALCVVLAGCTGSSSSSATSASEAASESAEASGSESASAEASESASASASASVEASASASSSASSAASSSASAAASESASASSAASESASAAASSSASAASAQSIGTNVTAEDLAKVDIVVEYGDFEKIKELASDVTNGRATGKVVQIDGEVINFDKTMSFGIGEANAQGNERRGVTFVIVGLSTDEYPADRTHIKLTGIIASDGENPGFRIYTLPEFVEVVEE